MSEVCDTDVFVRTTESLWRDLANGVVVLGPGARRPRLITGPAARLWSLVEQPMAFGAAVATLAAAHDVPDGVVRADLQHVLSVLRRDGAVELVS